MLCFTLFNRVTLKESLILGLPIKIISLEYEKFSTLQTSPKFRLLWVSQIFFNFPCTLFNNSTRPHLTRFRWTHRYYWSRKTRSSTKWLCVLIGVTEYVMHGKNYLFIITIGHFLVQRGTLVVNCPQIFV